MRQAGDLAYPRVMPSLSAGSYPPVSRFHRGIGEAEFRDAIRLSNDDPIPRQLSLCVRVPAGQGPEFECDIARLEREIDLVSRLVDRDREVMELRVTAGVSDRSPPLAAVRDLLDVLRHQFHFSPEAFSELPVAVDPQNVAADRQGPLQRGRPRFTTCTDCDLLGFGVGSISQVRGCLSQNAVAVETWRRAIDAGRLPVLRGLRLSADDEIRGDVIRHLLCRRSITIGELERSHGIEFRSYFAAELARLTPCFRLGLLQDFGDRIEVCSQGWTSLRRIARCFDAYAHNERPRQEAWQRH